MPQVFSSSWLYLFLLIMAFCVFRIVVKVREIHRGQDPDAPVIKVAPLAPSSSHHGEDEEGAEALGEADGMIREGRYGEAAALLEGAVKGLSPVEDRELLGKIQYRIGACRRRLGWKESETSSLLRSGEALREAVGLFSPHRLRSQRMGALSELAGLYEDLADRQNPPENLAAALKTWEAAARTARMSSQPSLEAVFLSRQGDLFRKAASLSDRRGNLEKALELYRKAVAVPGAFSDEDSLPEKAGILKGLGDLLADLSGVREDGKDTEDALKAYDEALMILSAEKDAARRGITFLAAGNVHLAVYRARREPGHLVKGFEKVREALNLLKAGEDASAKGRAMELMGDALVFLSEFQGKDEHLERAIRFYEGALGFFRDPGSSADRDRVRESLRKAVEGRKGKGERPG